MPPVTPGEQIYAENLHHAKLQISVQEQMLEWVHAMMVLQDLCLCQLNCALKAKEEKKKKGTDQRKILLADGHGRHMTNDEFITVLEEDKKTCKDNDVRAAKKHTTREK